MKENFLEWDWTKSNKELALEHHVFSGRVCVVRRALGMDKATKWYPACKSWDWTISDTELARIHRCNVATAKRWRWKLAKPAPSASERREEPSGFVAILRRDYSTLDWCHKTDSELARETGLTREYMRQKRASLGLPKFLFVDLLFQQFLDDVKDLPRPLSIAVYRAHSKHPVSDLTFVRYCAKAKIDRCRSSKPTLHPWHLMNWSIPNLILGRIWGVSNIRVVMWRCNKVIGKPAFRRSQAKEHKEEILKEEIKARIHKGIEAAVAQGVATDALHPAQRSEALA